MAENVKTEDQPNVELQKDHLEEKGEPVTANQHHFVGELELNSHQLGGNNNINSNSKSPRTKDINDSQTILIERNSNGKGDYGATDAERRDSDIAKGKGHNLKILADLEESDRKNQDTPSRNDEKSKSLTNTSSPMKRKTVREEDEVDVFKDNAGIKRNPRIEMLDKFLNSKIFQYSVNTFTIFALFGDDIKVACLPKSADMAFNVLTIISIVLFTVEIIISSIAKKDYFLSFFFWLDILGTVTLFFDLTWVNSSLFSGGGIGNAATLARAGRASRVGTKAGRVVRLVRLSRLVKIYKKAKDKEFPTRSKVFPSGSKKKDNSQKKSQKNQPPKGEKAAPDRHQSISNPSIEDEEIEVDATKESRVGKRLSELTTKRVIVIVLTLVMFVPMFQADLYYDFDKGYTMGVGMIQNIAEKYYSQGDREHKVNNDILIMWNKLKDLFANEMYPFAYCYIPSMLNTPSPYQIGTINFLDYLRDDEYDLVYASSEKYKENFIGVIDIRHKTQIGAWINIARTIYVCIVLGVGALMFSKDANELVLHPIERMIEKVNKIARNPLSSRNEAIVKSFDKEQMETTVIENAIIKIGTLLALGFGDAGSEIIAVNMAKGGDVDAMLPGKKKYAIFGFCDIRNFTDATEVLQEDVMLFVNSIGEIVHKTVDFYGGSANKNIGDAFLLVWKFPEDEILIEEDGKCELNRTRGVKNVADLAIISFLKIIARINRHPVILEYRNNKKLCDRMPGYRVKMGFGLHIGWAIEGAIGSEYKIDASYLSPNVNMASRLEAATKQYGVPLLISHELHRYFSKETRSFCREIDRVTVKGSKKPIGLFTCDLDVSELQPSKIKVFPKDEARSHHNAKKGAFLESLFTGGKKSSAMFHEDKDLILVTKKTRGPLMEKWKEAFSAYVAGTWKEAKSLLEACAAICPEDGPTGAIMGVIRETNFTAPADWKGYRELTEK